MRVAVRRRARPTLPGGRPVLLLAVLSLGVPGSAAAQSRGAPYFPPAGDWERRAPEELGMSSTLLRQAIDFALANPSGMLQMVGQPESVQVERQLAGLKQMGEPNPQILGPMKAPRDVNGIILKGGYIVAEWGDTRYVDLTASLSKSILSTVAGITYDRRLIPDLDARVGALVRDGGFDSPHNSKITWRMLLQQTSEWEGTLWDTPDLADRRTRRNGEPLSEPGTFWDYNDVRVNRLSLSLLRLWKRPLPEVLRENVMDPIGATRTWEWHGYRNSWVEIDGRRMQSVSGGAHWGGGFWVSAEDLARIGLLYARGGEWSGRRVLSEAWIREATSPAAIRGNYGFLWWLNADPQRRVSSAAPPTAFYMAGGGGYYCWVDRENDLVVVVKNLGGNQQTLGEFVDRVVASLKGS